MSRYNPKPNIAQQIAATLIIIFAAVALVYHAFSTWHICYAVMTAGMCGLAIVGAILTLSKE